MQPRSVPGSKIGRVKRALPVLLLVLAGCVERKLVIKPDPSDAIVFVDGNEIALVKSETVYRYEHYGIHRVQARKAGFEVKEQLVTLDPPWYQVFPLDFFFDILWPATIEDRREVSLTLVQRGDLSGKQGEGDAVLKRAREFADESRKP
jgi:hypothetical protein